MAGPLPSRADIATTAARLPPALSPPTVSREASTPSCLALVAIHNLHTPLTAALVPYIGTSSGSSVLAFAILLLVPYAIVKLLSDRLGAASRNSVLGPIDRVIGFGFGAIKGMVITTLAFSVLVLGFDLTQPWITKGRPDWITQARSYPFVNSASEALVKMIGERRRTAAEAAAQDAVKRKAIDSLTGK